MLDSVIVGSMLVKVQLSPFDACLDTMGSQEARLTGNKRRSGVNSMIG
jgi:hypothetical protein